MNGRHFHRIRRNGVFKVLGEVGGRGLGILYVALLARWVGDEGFARYSFALSFSLLFSALLDFGANSLLVRDLARTPGRVRETVERSNSLRLLGAGVTFAAIFLAHLLVSEGQPARALVPLLALLVIATGVLEYHAAIFSGLERMGLEAILRVVNRAFCLAGAYLGYVASGSLAAIVVGMLAGFAVSLVFGAGLVRFTGGTLALRWDPAWNRRTLVESAPLLLSLGLWKLYENQSVVVMTLLGTPLAQVGWYAAAIRLVDMLRAVPALLSGSVFPVLAESVVADRSAFLRVARFALKSSLALALPLIAGTILLSRPIMTTIFAPEYEPGSQVLAVAIVATLGIFLNGIMINVLIAADHQRQTTPGAFLVTLVNLALVLALVPRFGGLGAAWSLVASESLYLVYNGVLVHRRLGLWNLAFVGYAWRPCAATALMAGALRFVPATWNVILVALIGAAVYAVALILVRGIPDRR
jgi:O-antigen/teichoic acid export membrane protein